MDIPETPEEFSLDWMNEALEQHLAGGKVVKVEAKYHDTPGQTAGIVALDLKYDGVQSLPASMIAKVKSSDLQTIENVVNPLDLYFKEFMFYKSLVAGIEYPACYYSDFNRESSSIILLLEDISSMSCPSWNPTIAQVETAVRNLAPFHARWWNNPELLKHKWLTKAYDSDLFGMYADLAYQAIARVEELADEDMSYADELVVCFHDNLSAALDHVKTRPFTFVHGDYHPKQMFFSDEPGERDFLMIDWQLPICGPGANDLSRIIVVGLDTQTRRQNESRLIEMYLDGLREGGVNDYSMDELIDDYRYGIFISCSIHYLAAATDIELFINEVTALGLDWQEVAYYRIREALKDHDGHKLLQLWGKISE